MVIGNYDLKPLASGILNGLFAADTVIHGKNEIDALFNSIIDCLATDAVAALIAGGHKITDMGGA